MIIVVVADNRRHVMKMTRRHMFAVSSAAAAMTFTRAAFGGWEPSERYPDPAVKSLDPSFNRYRLFNASIERLATGMRWCEGPVWFGDARKCYIEDSGPNPRPIYAYDVVDDGTRLVNKRVLITAEPNGTPDGFRVDMDGNLWCGWGMGNAELDGVKVFNPEGTPIGFIALPERCAN